MRNNSSHRLIGLMADRRPDLLIGVIGYSKFSYTKSHLTKSEKIYEEPS
jgi:hypothetical protein